MLSNYRRMLTYTWREWRLLVVTLAMAAASSAAVALQPWPLKILIDYALEGQSLPPLLESTMNVILLKPSPVSLITGAAVASLLVFAISSGLEAGITWAWSVASQRMTYALSGDVFHRLQRISPLFQGKLSVGESMSRLTGDTTCVHKIADALLISPLKHLLTLIAIGVLAWQLNPQLALVSLIVAPLLGGATFFFGRWLKHRARREREAKSQVLRFTQQTLASIPVVQAFGTEDRNGGRFRDLSSAAVAESQRGVLLKGLHKLVTGSTMVVGTAVIIVIGGQQVIAGALSVGSLIVFLSYLRTVQKSSQHLFEVYVQLKKAEASVDRVLEILDADDVVRDESGATPINTIKGSVQFDEVSVGYEPGHQVLREVAFQVSPGETIAIVGETGAGKSTLVSMIPRLFDPWSGRILIDGRDVRDVTIYSLREHVALVMQEPFLLPLSIAENIAFGKPEATREEIESAAKAANAHQFIERLPENYDTILGQRGATLSGGERQRLSIARALLKDARILILDEPTSAVDAGTERELLQAFERLMEGRTTFIIAHRLSTIRQASRIIVLERGRVVEIGSHAELFAREGYYHHFYTLQFPRAKEGVA